MSSPVSGGSSVAPGTPLVPVLEALDISKQFYGIKALSNVAVQIYQGEILAIIGENGAGKSTLMKVLAGVHQPDSGQVGINGAAVNFYSPSDAMKHGISLIHQELNLADNLTIADNLFLGRELLWAGPLKLLDRKAMLNLGAKFLARVGLDVDPSVLVGSLPPGQKQLVEIARSLSLNGRILIMDEPTSSLSQKESDQLVEVIKELSSEGVSVVYISHRLGEVKRVAHRVVGLRDGRNAGTLATHEISHDAMVRMMVGRDLEKFSKPLALDQSAKVRLELQQFKFIGGTPSGVTFQLKAGEILGMAGLVGAGRTELAETLFGIRPSQGGRAILDGKNFLPRSPVDAIAAGLLLVPEDRRHHGLILLQSIKHNLSLPNLKTISRFFLVDPFKEAKLSSDSIQRLAIKTTNANKLAGLLSGGNQQKVVLAKWLAVGPKVLILDEPTRGVDVGAKAEIYELIRHLASLGVSILMISSDMEEVIRLSQRVIVLHEGNLQGELSGNDINEESVMLLATGSKEVTAK